MYLVILYTYMYLIFRIGYIFCSGMLAGLLMKTQIGLKNLRLHKGAPTRKCMNVKVCSNLSSYKGLKLFPKAI